LNEVDYIVRVRVLKPSLVIEYPAGSSPVTETRTYTIGDILDVPLSRRKQLGSAVELIVDEEPPIEKTVEELRVEMEEEKIEIEEVELNIIEIPDVPQNKTKDLKVVSVTPGIPGSLKVIDEKPLPVPMIEITPNFTKIESVPPTVIKKVEAVPVVANPEVVEPLPNNLPWTENPRQKITLADLKKNQVYLPGLSTVATRFDTMYSVTVIIYSYNQRVAVLETLKKLTPQLLPTDLIIVVDDGSTDGTYGELLDEYPSVISLSTQHQGIRKSLAVAMKEVETTHSCANVILLDPAEKIGKNFISNLMKDMWKNPKKVKTKKTTKTIGLYSSYVHFSNIRPLEQHLKEHTPYRPVWTKSWQYHTPEEKPYNKKYDRKISVIRPDADIYVTVSSEHRVYQVYDAPKTVFTLHGLSPAELGCVAEHNLYDWKGMLLPGPWYLDQIKSGEYYEEDRGKVHTIEYDRFPPNFFKVVGWMKGDILFRSEVDEAAQKIIQDHNIKLPFDKTVLYAPTGYWGIGYGSFGDTIDPLINACNYLELNLIIKLHFGTIKMNKTKPQYDAAKKKTENMKSVTWIEALDLEDITPLYTVADTLVSDASSCVLEFLQTDRIGIEMTNRNVPIPYAWRGYLMPYRSTVTCPDVKDLKKLLMRTIYRQKDYAKQIKMWQKKLFFALDGKSCERAVKALEELMEW